MAPKKIKLIEIHCETLDVEKYKALDLGEQNYHLKYGCIKIFRAWMLHFSEVT